MQKKAYSAPEIISYGTVTELTSQGGGNFTDLPIGTPVPGDGDVTGNLS